jgi:RES domain
VRAGAVVVAYRLASWRRPLRTEPSRVAGRFHRSTEDSPTQYLCLHPLGPWAEFLRATGLEGAEQLAVVRHRTWALRIDVSGLVPIGFAEAGEHGLRPCDLVSDDLRACHRLADRLRAAGVPGAIVPSAALPGTDNVVLFGERAAAPYLVEPLSAVDVPASLTADGGRPPLGLLERVRRRGAAHAALEAWRAGVPYRLTEPSWAEWTAAA